MRRPSILIFGIVVSVWLHVGFGAFVKRLPEKKVSSSTIVAVVEKKKPKKKEEERHEEKPKPPEPEAPKIVAPKTIPRPAPKPVDAPPPTPAEAPKAAAAPNAFAGTGLGGLPNVGNFSGNGIAVPRGGGGGGDGTDSALAGGAKLEKTTAKEKVLGGAPKTDGANTAGGGDDCTGEVGKPKPTSMPQPTYSDEARSAEIEGVVTVRVMVDASGHVSDAQIVKGLGHGLDERALAAARSWSFTPGMRCGKPAPSKYVVAMRFALGE